MHDFFYDSSLVQELEGAHHELDQDSVYQLVMYFFLESEMMNRKGIIFY